MRGRSLTERARRFCKIAHQNQFRKYTGKPYHTHPFAVAAILQASGIDDEQVLAAAYLHDVVEDTNVTNDDIEFFFNKRIASLVEQVTDVSKIEDGNRKVRKELDRMHLAKAEADAQSIKLADLIHNSISIIKHDPKFAKVYMREKEKLLEVLTRGDKNLYQRATSIVADYYKRYGYSSGV